MTSTDPFDDMAEPSPEYQAVEVEIDWTNRNPRFDFATEVQALRTLQQLAHELEAARTQERHVMRYMAAAVRAARAVREGGQPTSKEAIIGHSGLARKTVYRILGEVGPDGDTAVLAEAVTEGADPR